MQATRTGKTGYVPIDYLESVPPQTPATKPSMTGSGPMKMGSSLASLAQAAQTQSSQPQTSQRSITSPTLPTPSVFSTPEPTQGLRMSLSSLIDKTKTENPPPPQPPQPTFTKTPQVKPKADLSSSTSSVLPFGLGDSKASQSAGPANSLSALKKGGKLLKAAKTVQNMVKVTNVIATPRVPALSTAAEREDFDELMKRNDEYFARLLSSQVQYQL